MPAPLNSFRAFALAAATGAALALGTAGATAETVVCEAAIADLVTLNVGCETSPGASQDFNGGTSIANYTVNQQGFFDKSDWGFVGKLNFDGDDEGIAPSLGTDSDGQGGTFSILASLWDEYGRIMAIFKGGSNPLVGYELKPGETTFTYASPFLRDGKKPQGVSHISIYANGTPVAPIPLPAAAWLMLTGLGGLAVTQIRRRRKAA
ncbi:VPLPA-CTERM sorting domain-containing protein [Pararhodobacter sp. SW119]|uniref:VPLPA-CTERM sorting domain-containing protein n=1 Tax=Pararhodobacter sp. SW119 TaxID=2780075 RepID=UPI001FD7322D|nr:VPLPA-CTERM sorting domain-containing protein [Pararhodobacter sp. SW119]